MSSTRQPTDVETEQLEKLYDMVTDTLEKGALELDVDADVLLSVVCKIVANMAEVLAIPTENITEAIEQMRTIVKEDTYDVLHTFNAKGTKDLN